MRISNGLLISIDSNQGRTEQTPAMAAGISEHIWTIEEIVGLVNK